MMWLKNIVLFNCFLVMIVVALESESESGDVINYEEFCTINTNSGRLRGKLNRTLFEDVPYYSFRGIPFAKPPIGHLRFKVNNLLFSEGCFVWWKNRTVTKIALFPGPTKNWSMERNVRCT